MIGGGKMPKIKIITDSTCDLTPDLLEKNDIAVLPLHVNFKDTTYQDNVDINTDKLYELVEECGYLPTTSATSPGVFYEAFKKYLDEGYDIVYTGIGNELSATMKAAFSAKQMLEAEGDRIYIVDSMNLSSGIGLLLLKAVKFREEGLDAKTIAHKLEELAPKVSTQFVIDTMQYLYKGGRLSALSAFMGTVLKIKPIIRVRNGVLQVGKKPRGSLLAGVKILVDEVLALGDQIDDDFLMITHSHSDESAEYIKKELIGKVPVKNIYETFAGCVISSHCGPGTIGILYIVK